MPPLPPTWDGLHPLVVHFPIALFVVAPLFVLIHVMCGMRAFMIGALVLLVLGTAGAFVAVSTGEEAMGVMEPDDEDDELYDRAWDVADEHEASSIFARNIFTGVTIAYLLWTIVAFAAPKSNHLMPRVGVGALLLGVCVWGNLQLAHAAHLGGELVHRHGVRAMLGDLVEEAVEEVEEEMESESDAEQDESSDAEADEQAELQEAA